MVDFMMTQPPLHLQPRKPAAEAAVVAVASPQDEIRHGKPHDRVLMQTWLRQARVPSWLTTAWTAWDGYRKYLHTDLFADDQPRQVTVNLAARAIQQKVRKILPTEADLEVRHERGVGSVDIVRRDAIRRAAAAMNAAGVPLQAPLLMRAAEQAEMVYRQDMEARERICQTSEALGKKLWDEAGGTAAAQDLALQTKTTGVGWLKVGWQREYGRDSLGQTRNDDAQDQMALLALRASEFAAGRFGENDAGYGELIRLSEFARQVGRGVVDGSVEPGSMPFAQWQGIADTRDGTPVPPQWLPEPEVWQGATVDTVRPEALRWDWRLPFSKWAQSPWVMEQNLMDVDDVASRFRLTPSEKALLGNRDPSSLNADRSTGQPSQEGEQANPDSSNFESQVQRGKVVVWERWDRQLRRHCIFVEGLDRFLLDEIPGVVAPGFYPYIPVGFNLLDGAHLPESDVRFLRKIMDAINQRLTDANESIWASMKRYLVKKGAFRPGEMDKLRSSIPHDVIETEEPNDIKKSWLEISSDDWNPAKYSLDQLFRLFELMSGMSLSELGVVGSANFAAEVETSKQANVESAGGDALALAVAITQAFTIIIHYAATAMSERVVKDLVGDAAFWPAPPDRMSLIRRMRIKVSAAGSKLAAKARAGQEIRDVIAGIGSAFDLKARAAMAGGSIELEPIIAPMLRSIDVDQPIREMVRFDKVAESQAQAPQSPMLSGPTGPSPAGGAQPPGPQTMP